MLKSLNIGSFDRLISIQANAPSLAADGLPVDSWSNLYTNIPAQRKFKKGNEQAEEGKLNTTQEATYIVRWGANITAKCRIVEGTKEYQVTAVTELGRRQALELQCIEIEGAQ